MDLKELESAIEGILFAAGDPVPVERICLTLEQDRETVDSVCQRMADWYSYERRKVLVVRNCMGRPGTARRPASQIRSRSSSSPTV